MELVLDVRQDGQAQPVIQVWKYLYIFSHRKYICGNNIPQKNLKEENSNSICPTLALPFLQT